MRQLFFLLCLCALTITLCGAAPKPKRPAKVDSQAEQASPPISYKEIAYLDGLIESSEQTLKVSKVLRGEVKSYLEMQDRFAKNTEDKDLCYRMVKAAKRIQADIEANHLSQAFSQEFLNELAIFSKIGNKRGVPSP